MFILPISVPAIFEDADSWLGESFKEVSNMEISTDANFANITSSFSVGQTVYVRISSNNDGADSRSLNLRDSGYGLITSYQLSKSGSQFSASFPSPQNAGTYSLEADIKSGGSVLSLVKTIQVGAQSQTNSNVSVKIDNQVNANSSQSIQYNSASSPPSQMLPTPSPVQEPRVMGKATANVFESIWQKLTNFFQNVFGKKQLTMENGGGNFNTVTLPQRFSA